MVKMGQLVKGSPASYRSDTLFPRVAAVVQALLAEKKPVAPLEVFLRLGYVNSTQVQDWRCRRIPYLERVIGCNLSKISRVLQILQGYARELGLTATTTSYQSYGRGPRAELQFSKTGHPNLEKVWRRCFRAVPRADAAGSPPPPLESPPASRS